MEVEKYLFQYRSRRLLVECTESKYGIGSKAILFALKGEESVLQTLQRHSFFLFFMVLLCENSFAVDRIVSMYNMHSRCGYRTKRLNY